MADHFNQLDEDRRRLVVRGDIKQWNQLLAETAHDAGVISNEEFAIFQNAGYMGLYGGLDVDAHAGKDIHGNDWNIRDLEDGSQLWVTSKNGVIQNGGLNKPPKPWDEFTGLSQNIVKRR